MPIEILFRDEDIVAVNKPSGLLTHRGWGNDRVVAMSLVRDLVGTWVYPLHRLDRATSGVLLFALSPQSAGRYGALFEQRSMRKTYVALVRGVPGESGLIDHPIAKEKGGEKKEAQTEFFRLGFKGRYSLVACFPRTGRPHQVRRHLKHISCPIIGDVRYGKGEHNRYFRENHALHRLALHCLCMEWDTIGGAEQSIPGRNIVAPVPPDLLAPLRALGLCQDDENLLSSIRAKCSELRASSLR